VGLVLCGGIIDPLLLAAIIERGMVRAADLPRVRVSARDVPGSLPDHATVAEAGATSRGAITSARSPRCGAECEIELVIQTRGARTHRPTCWDALRNAGIPGREGKY
jgi:threonine dehydratase